MAVCDFHGSDDQHDMNRNSDFAIERQLRRLDPALRWRFTDAASALRRTPYVITQERVLIEEA